MNSIIQAKGTVLLRVGDVAQDTGQRPASLFQPSQEAFDPQRDYVTVRVKSYWGAGGGGLFKSLRSSHSTMDWRISSGRPGAEQVDQRSFLTPRILGDDRPAQSGVVLQRNLQVLGPLRYRPDLRLDFMLYEVRDERKLGGALDILSDLAFQAAIPAVAAARPFAEALGRGIDRIAGYEDGLAVRAGLSQGLADGAEKGWFILINPNGNKLDVARLSIRSTDHVPVYAGKELDMPFVVFEIATSQHRADWQYLDDIKAAWEEVREAARAGGGRETIDAAFKRFKQEVWLSLDLTQADQHRIVNWSEARWDSMASSFEATDGEGFDDPGPLGGLDLDEDARADTSDYDTKSAGMGFENATTRTYPTLDSYGAGFKHALDFLLRNEGGFVDNAADFGGKTNYGITQATFDAWRDGQGHPRESVRHISPEEAAAIYDANYWSAARCDRVNEPRLALLMLDTAALFGPTKAQRFLQMALLAHLDETMSSSTIRSFVDGRVGPGTLAVLDRARDRGKLDEVMRAMLELRAGYHRARVIEELRKQYHQGEFIAGWLKRVEHVHEKIFGAAPAPDTYAVWANPRLRHALEAADGRLDGLDANAPSAPVEPAAPADPVETQPVTAPVAAHAAPPTATVSADPTPEQGPQSDWTDPIEEDVDDADALEELETIAAGEDIDPAAHQIATEEAEDADRVARHKYGETLVDILEAVRESEASGNVTAIRTLLKTYKRERQFDRLHLGALLSRADGLSSSDAARRDHGLELLRLEVQALNEFGQFARARTRAQAIITQTAPTAGSDPNARKDWLEAQGMIGRSYKQELVELIAAGTTDSDQLQRVYNDAFSAYAVAWNTHREHAIWHAVNVLALANLGTRIGVSVPGIDAADLANTIIAKVEERVGRFAELDGKTDAIGAGERAEHKALESDHIWEIASKAEALLALGRFDEASKAYASFIEHITQAYGGESGSFEVFSAYRQLKEVWGLEREDAPEGAKRLFIEMKLAASRLPGEQVAFTDQEMAFISANGFEGFDGHILTQSHVALTKFEALHGRRVVPVQDWLNAFVRSTHAIARIDLNRTDSLTGQRPPKGTGFLVKGEALHPDWEGQVLFLTNEHVISRDTSKRLGVRAIKPGSALVRFTIAAPEEGCKVTEILFQSDREDHDVVVCRLDRVPEGAVVLDRVRGDPLPDLEAEDQPFEITVVGHPQGRTMSFGQSNLRLQNHDGPDADGNGRPVRMHYHSPTEPGNSGSPAFDWSTFELVGLHHSGTGFEYEYVRVRDRTVKKRKGIKPINEAITLRSIRQAIMVTRTARRL